MNLDGSAEAMVDRFATGVPTATRTFGKFQSRMPVGRQRSSALGSAAQQRSEKPLLIEFAPPTWRLLFASPRLPRPPGVFCGLAIRWQYAVAIVDHAEPNPNSILVPAQGFEPWTIGLKDRCSAKLSYAG